MPLAYMQCKAESAEDAVDMAIRHAENNSVPGYLDRPGYSDYEVLGVIDADQNVFYEPRKFTVPAPGSCYHVEDVVALFDEETSQERYDKLKRCLCGEVVAEHWGDAHRIIDMLEGIAPAMRRKVDPDTVRWLPWLPEVNAYLMGIRDCIISLNHHDDEGTRYIVVVECC